MSSYASNRVWRNIQPLVFSAWMGRQLQLFCKLLILRTTTTTSYRRNREAAASCAWNDHWQRSRGQSWQQSWQGTDSWRRPWPSGRRSRWIQTRWLDHQPRWNRDWTAGLMARRRWWRRWLKQSELAYLYNISFFPSCCVSFYLAGSSLTIFSSQSLLFIYLSIIHAPQSSSYWSCRHYCEEQVQQMLISAIRVGVIFWLALIRSVVSAVSIETRLGRLSATVALVETV